MVIRRIGLVAFAMLTVAAGSRALADQNNKVKAPGHCIFDALAQKLGLSDQQKSQAWQLHQEYDQKTLPILTEMHKLRHDQRQEIEKVLTQEQRAELPTVMWIEVDKALRDTADKLGLSQEQRKLGLQIAVEFRNKMQAMMKQKNANNEQQCHQLKVQEFEAFCNTLTHEQRVKLPGVLRGEIRLWGSEHAQTAVHNDIANRLHLTADQRKKIDSICSTYGPKIDKQKQQIKQTWTEEHAQVRKLLTDAQRKQFDDLLKTKESGK